MRTSDQFEMIGEKNTPERHAKMVCAIWEMTPRRHVYIGAANLDALEDIWKEVTGTELVKDVVQMVRVHPDSTHRNSYVTP